ncbi:MAG: sortase, partial [Marmoricola sp.]
MTVETEAAPETVESDKGGPRRPRLLRVQRVPRPNPSPRSMLVSYALSLLSLLLICIVLNLTVISQFQHWTAQRKLYGELRLSLAQASTPVGQTDVNGKLTALGTPLALLDIPTLGIHEVVVEGTTSAQTKVAVGHRRDTPLPGQAGVSVLMGRQYAYGGVFGDIDRLRAGDAITITTGQGVARYRVIGPRLRTVRLP